MNRTVTFLRVHDMAALFKGLGANGMGGNLSGNELPMKSRHIQGLSMKEGPNGVEISFDGSMEIQIIPYTNVQKYDVIDPNFVPVKVDPKPGIWANKKAPIGKDDK